MGTSGNSTRINNKQSSKYDSIIHSMSQLRRQSLDSKLNLRNNRIEAESQSIGDKKSLDKTSSSAKDYEQQVQQQVQRDKPA